MFNLDINPFTMKHFLFAVGLLILSCTNSTDSVNIPKKKVTEISRISYETQHPIGNLKSHVFNKTEYVSFSEFRTWKDIQLFRMDGKRTWLLKLDEVDEFKHVDFIDYTLINPDSILLLTKNTNVVYLVNSDGKVLQKKDYSALLLDKIELLPALIYDNQKIYLTIMQGAKNRLESLDDYLNYSKTKLESPKVFIDSNFFDSNSSYSQELYGFYKQLGSFEYLYPDLGGRFNVFDHTHFCYFSNWTDTVYFYNNQFKLTKKLHIDPKTTAVTLKPITWKQHLNSSDDVNNTFIENSFITKFHHIASSGIYVCKVQHKKTENKFTILGYSKKFQPLFEETYDYEKFAYCCTTEDGFLMQDMTNKKQEVMQLTLFRYE